MFKTVEEGLAKIKVPSVEKPEDGRGQGFYNPVMKENRDISVAVFSIFIKKYFPSNRSVKILDALTATGIRAIRYRKELDGVEVWATDVNENAIKLAKKNAILNNVKIKIEKKDANLIMCERGFDIIDIDPYGTPVMFIDSAFHSIGRFGLLAVTATDTAALNGVYPVVSERRYGIRSVKTQFSKELGTRILLTHIIREGMKYDKAFIPLLSYQSRHYIRLFGLIRKSVEECNKLLKNIKYLFLADSKKNADKIYLGPLHNKKFCSLVLKELQKRKLDGKKIALLAHNELDIPFYYDIHKLARIYKKNIPRTEKLIKRLKKHGYKASKTIFSDIGIKTNAKEAEVIKYFET